ncbi:phage/plasmid primase, P4 family [Lachnoanaerobaculum saburreum]|uniref:Phage/plasmid primase, P4 family domain protein n=1 Tax=Lachnoanaerobaculum saburreum DSM 3986 TaxID=887325 RepID=E6LMA0_9FIRM|nr:phage/plasmid primase, P4 family [Lachnoanaerobaculum saburreum]EFU76995.1 phage/plasmid primase, P4 family domain protein [Lachnoanaerobaculum saburreum DSM 3986]
MEYKEFLKHFDLNGATPRNNTINVRCPCHNDKKASLSISQGRNNRIILKCHAGCNYKNILSEVGLTEDDLFNDGRTTQEKNLLTKIASYVDKPIEAVYDYKDANGKYLYSKIRFIGKHIRYAVIDKKNDSFTMEKPKGVYSLYNLPAAIRAIKKGYPVYITEGEKDVDTLKDLGFTAVTAGSVSDWRSEFAHYFTGARVVILPDNDAPGLELKDKILKSLRAFAHSIKVVITSQAEHGDVTDYLEVERHSKEDLKELIKSVDAIVAPWVELTERKDGTIKQRINVGLLKACIGENLSYKCVDSAFYWYCNGYYKHMDKNAVKAKISAYIPDALTNDNLLNNVYNLMLADVDHMANEKNFNTNEKYINFKNGLYNIDTKALEPHNADILYTRQVNTEYIESYTITEYHTFTKFIRDLCKSADGGIDWQAYKSLQEVAGLAISNIYGHKTKKAVFLYSPVGNTGKSQFLGLLGHLIGQENITSIPLQNMNEDKGRFAFANAGLVRLIMNGDQSKADVKDSSIFKSVTGGDAIKVEAKGKDIRTLVFKGLVVIACNDLPYIADDKGEHIYRRMYIVPCTHTIEEKERDPNILDKMIKELPAIANWGIEGLHRLRANNYNFTEIAAGAEVIANYRKNSDTVYSFLMDEGYIITKNPADKVSKQELLTAYNKYCQDNGRQAVGVRQFRDRIVKLTGYTIHKTRLKNILASYCEGLKLSDEFIPVNEGQAIPFE